MNASHLETRKARARAWFEQLRDDICARIRGAGGRAARGRAARHRLAGRFARTPWSRTDHTGARPTSGLPESATQVPGRQSRPGAAAA